MQWSQRTSTTPSTLPRTCVAPREHSSTTGLFDLLLLPSASRSLLLALFVLLPSGAHGGVPGVRYVQASSVVLRPQRRRGVLNVDGEIVEYDGPFSIQCKRKLIPLLMDREWQGRNVPGVKERQS